MNRIERKGSNCQSKAYYKIDNVFGAKRFNFKSATFNIIGITLKEALKYLQELKGTITESLIINGRVEQSFYMVRG